MANTGYEWENYFQWDQGRAPRPFLLEALERFPADVSLRAIDLGCGDGKEALILLARGWHVLAIDGAEAGIQRLIDQAPAESLPRLQTQVTRFKGVILPPADLILASYSLPFCRPQHFPALWEQVAHSVKPGGRFAGNFFGPRDSWANVPKMTFHTAEQVRALMDGLEIETFEETEEDGQSANGPKHWHVFTVIARKWE